MTPQAYSVLRWLCRPARGQGDPPPPPLRDAVCQLSAARRLLTEPTPQVDCPGLQVRRDQHHFLARKSRGVCDAQRRHFLISPYKKCYVAPTLPRANRCRAPDLTRKFGGYMEGWCSSHLFPWGLRVYIWRGGVAAACSRGVRGMSRVGGLAGWFTTDGHDAPWHGVAGGPTKEDWLDAHRTWSRGVAPSVSCVDSGGRPRTG